MSEASGAAVVDGKPATDCTNELALIDLSSIAYPIWHMSGSNPDPDYTSTQIIARVRALTANHPRAAICCDSGKSFRHQISATYKANRPAQEAPFYHQMALARERLAADGYPVWSVKGFEADDLIASACVQALALPDVSVLIVSSDKDLLHLVGPRVRAMSAGNGTVYDAAAVVAKFGVTPEQMRDYLTLVGDASDNVRGAKKIGAVTAAKLLKRYGSIAEIYRNLDEHGTQFTPAIATSLREFAPILPETQSLITLRTDVELPLAEVDQERQPAEAEPVSMEVDEMSEALQNAPAEQGAAVAGVGEPRPIATPESAKPAAVPAVVVPAAPVEQPAKPAQSQALAVVPDVLAPAPVEFERQLEPRSLPQAMSLANHMHAARMFSGYGSPQGVLSTILAGRELGFQAVASLRAFHNIESKHALAADAMRALVLQKGKAKYFRVVERTAERATFETHREGEPEPIRLTYTIDDGRQAFGFYDGMPDKLREEREKSWRSSGWGKNPADMNAARASSKLARLVYPDVLFGLYAPEELRD